MTVHDLKNLPFSSLQSRLRIIAKRALPVVVGLLLLSWCPSFGQSKSVPAQTPHPDSTFAGVPPASTHSQHPPASNTLTYWYGTRYRTPFVLKPGTGDAANIHRNSLEFVHSSFWALGNNFADVMVSQSNMAEPASNGGTGATELYFILRSALGFNEMGGTEAFRKGPVRDLAMEFGTNLETKNSSFAPAERTLYIGPRIDFAVPHGYLHVGFHYRKEWNHEGVLGRSENYSPGFNIEPTWLFPINAGKLHLAWSGFAEYNTPKGKDSFGSETVSEFLMRNTIAADVGSLLFGRTQLLDLNAGLWYWHNEYGKPVSDPGAEQVTPMIGMTIHLDGGRSVRGKR